MSAKFSVIVVAAGESKRFGDNESKIFATVDGQPVFIRALQLFVNREDVCQTILVVSPQDDERMRQKFGPNLGFMGVKLVTGGAERHDSVAKGLEAVTENAQFVAVHDAARVCVASQWIDAVFEAAAKHGAAIPTIPVTSTLKRVKADHTIAETVSRDGLHQAQTPQVFRKELIQAAYAALAAGELNLSASVTDDAQVVAAAGHPVATVPGDARNIKITTKSDLSLVGAVLKVLPQKPISRSGVFEEAKW